MTRRKPSRLTTGRLQFLRLFSTLLAIALKMPEPRDLSVIAFHEKAGRSQVDCSCLFITSFPQPSRHCRHPSIRTLDERLFRSVQVGRSRYSRCCHLIVDLRSSLSEKLGQAINAVTGTRRLGFVFSFPKKVFLSCCRDCHSLAVMQRFVHLSAHPQVMQEYRQLSCRSNDGSLLPALATTLG